MNGHNMGPNNNCDAIVVWALCKFFFHFILVFINLLIYLFCFVGFNLLVTTDRHDTTRTNGHLCQPPPLHENGV
jgi:hypothetical protein